MGSVTVTDAAASSPKGVSCCPAKKAIWTGMVLDVSLVVKVRARRNSFQQKIKTKMAAVANPGVASGNNTLRKALQGVQPSTRAAL